MVPRPHKSALLGAAGVMTLGSFAAIGIPLLTGWLINRIKGASDAGTGYSDVRGVAVLALSSIAVLLLLREGLNVFRRYLVENTCTRIDKHLNVRVVSHLLRTDLNHLTHENVGAIHGRVCRSIEGFIRFLRLSFLDFFPAIFTGGIALVAVLSKQPWMALAMVGVIPISISLTAWQLMSQKGIRLSLMRGREELDGTIVEQIGGIEYVRAANTIDREVGRVEVAAEHRRAGEIKHHFEMSLFGCAKALTEGAFHVIVLSASIYLWMQGRIEVGDVAAFSALFLSVMQPLSEIHRVLDEGHESSLRVADLLAILNRPLDRSFETPDKSVELDPSLPVIEVENLQADYQIGENRRLRVLNEVTLKVQSGETIGVAGCSGSGKSTWLKVLLRLLHPGGGEVRIGGVPIEQMSRAQIARLFGYVGQSPFIFAGTVEDNIAYGCAGATFADVQEAAKRAGIHDEITNMPDGYKSRLAERGQNLSGGQRQRLAIARVFLKNPPVLILDEATSALDSINERHVQEAIDAARADRTVILVAHRLSTLTDADRIVVFEDGRIAEVGTYDGLIERNGVFASLVRHARREAVVDRSPEVNIVPAPAINS
ncbi:MAG: ABC transporter ATP-binding protein [Gemmataceae bacterium]